MASKLPPSRTSRTWFSSGRAAFAYIVQEVVKPRRVWLPTFTCWSLVTTMQRRFPSIELCFYTVHEDLSCDYPTHVGTDELLVFIHYFGYENAAALPDSDGTILEDFSHAYLSRIHSRGDLVFGSCRKMMKVGDGGFIDAAFNPVYEPSRKLDTWLRYEAKDWRDMREAENMMDREWVIGDISSQSLAVILGMDHDLVRQARQKNERFLFDHLGAGRPLREFRSHECPLIHQRLFDSSAERDSLRSFLAARGIFTSIHWPTPAGVAGSGADIRAARFFEEHSMAIPVSSDFNLNDMEAVVRAVEEWSA